MYVFCLRVSSNQKVFGRCPCSLSPSSFNGDGGETLTLSPSPLKLESLIRQGNEGRGGATILGASHTFFQSLPSMEGDEITDLFYRMIGFGGREVKDSFVLFKGDQSHMK